MNHFQGRLRHELDGEFLRKFCEAYDEDRLNELIFHLDRYPNDGERLLEQVPEFRFIRWESAGCRRDIFYVYRERSGVLFYVDCVEPPDQANHWFRNLDPVQLVEISMKLFELIEKIFTAFSTFRLRSRTVFRVGGSLDYQQETIERS